MAKEKVKKENKIKIGDIAAAWKAGWTPKEVNEILDRLDAMGDPNDPEEVDDEDEDLDDLEDDEDIEDDDSENEDQDKSDEDEEVNDSDDDIKRTSTSKKKASDSTTLLEVENKRLKKQIEKLQAKNRAKDVSGKGNEKTMEQSLIDTFNELF